MVGIGDPVMSQLDPHGLAMHRLHRDATRFVNGHHVKDLSRLNRNVKKIVLVDDDAHAAMLQPRNLIRVRPYSDARDKSDTQLLDLIPFLTSIGGMDGKGAHAKLTERLHVPRHRSDRENLYTHLRGRWGPMSHAPIPSSRTSHVHVHVLRINE